MIIFMSSYRERLRGELERIGISNVANTLGVARNTVYNWMAKANTPLNMLFGLEALGVDIRYVITGLRTPKGSTPLTLEQYEHEPGGGVRAADLRDEGDEISSTGHLTAEEKLLLDRYASADDASRKMAHRVLGPDPDQVPVTKVPRRGRKAA